MKTQEQNQFIEEQKPRGVYDLSRMQEIEEAYRERNYAKLTGNYEIHSKSCLNHGILGAGIGLLSGLFGGTIIVSALTNGQDSNACIGAGIIMGAVGIPIGAIVGAINGRDNDRRVAGENNRDKIHYFEQYATEFDGANGFSGSPNSLVSRLQEIKEEVKAKVKTERQVKELEASLS